MTIDWKEQWKAHAPDFNGMVAQISLPEGKKIELLPGPGFGDRSHQTTRLILSLLAPLARSHSVFDIGCGSGILSLAAAALGASPVYACDIDQEALLHTSQNARHNHLPILFTPPPAHVDLILMNMISSEQTVAWKAHRRPFTHLLTSGVLSEEKEGYLAAALEKGWKLKEIASEGQWLAFHFTSTTV